MSDALSIEGLWKVYDNGLEALKGVDLKVATGDFFALLGPNGAGKSTTIGIICSLVNKSRGKVWVNGVDIDQDFSRAKRMIGIVPQEVNFNPFEAVFDIVVTQAGFYGLPRRLAVERTTTYLKKLDLWERRKDIARELSGGMKRRLMIARALVHDPQILILDEPTAGVDIEMRHTMWDFLRELNATGKTLILTTHYLEEAESLCRNIAIIDQGQIIWNSEISRLLSQLNQETFVLDTSEDFQPPADGDYDCRVTGPCRLEVSVRRGQSLNSLFAMLSEHGIQVLSMRNKVNRLEEMFIKLLAREQPSS